MNNRVKTRRPCSSKVKHKMSQCMLNKSLPLKVINLSKVLCLSGHLDIEKYPVDFWAKVFILYNGFLEVDVAHFMGA